MNIQLNMLLTSEDSTIGEVSNLSSVDSAESRLQLNESDAQTELADSTVVTVESTTNPSINQNVSIPATPRSLVRVITADVTHRQVEPKDVIEYEWPPKSGDKYFLQEQIGELLDIKSFSRKFPDLSRRKVDKDERDWLCSVYNIHQIMNETQLRDMCAMRSVEIHDLMSNEYPVIYQEYQKANAERLKALMAEQAKEMEAIKNDSKKLAELREKTIRSVQEFNRELQITKKLERQHYWDIQTSIVQSGTNKWKKLSAKHTKPDPYPVALIHGQYQHYYRRFTPAELRKLPLGSVLDGTNLFPVYREPSPPPINVSERDMQRFERMAAQQNSGSVKIEMATPKIEPSRKSSILGNTHKMSSQSTISMCATCGEGPSFGAKFLKCASCSMQAHPECLDMSDDMIACVMTYPWNCIECKICTVCSKADREDKIMFCDRCDRGYHTFCVGVKEAPQGEWICEKFCTTELKRVQQMARRPLRRGSIAV